MIGIERRSIPRGCFLLIFTVSLIRLYHSSYVSLYEYAPRLLTNESSSNHTENNKKLNIVLLYADDVSYCYLHLISFSFYVIFCLVSGDRKVTIIIICVYVRELTLFCCLKVELQYTWCNGK